MISSRFSFITDQQIQENHLEDIMKQRMFVDMDGTLAEFHPVQSMEELHAEGYFAGLPPQRNVVEAVRILDEDPNID